MCAGIRARRQREVDADRTVVDAGGAVLPGATVVVKNAATASRPTVVTNSTGAFDVPVLDAGKVRADRVAQGFGTSMVTDLELLARRRVR